MFRNVRCKTALETDLHARVQELKATVSGIFYPEEVEVEHHKNRLFMS